MAPRVQLHSKLLGSLLLLCAICGCRPNTDRIKVNITDTNLSLRAGIFYYRDAPFTGTVYSLFPSGDTARAETFVEGKEDGWLKWWYPNKQTAQLRYFADGKKIGIHRGWWEDGKPKFEYNFVNDEHEGEAKEWFKNGKLFRLFHYKAGHEEGSEKMWWEDGKIRANYVVIDGEKFGLFGQKLCVNHLKK